VGDGVSLIILAIPLLLLYFMVTRGRKQQRELAATQDALEPGTRVMTSSGLFAEVVEVEDDAVILEIAPGVHTRWNKRAIGQVLPVAEEDEAAEEDEVTEEPGEPVITSAPEPPKSTEAVRSEAGYAAPPEADATEGSTGTTGITGTDGR
jgi:preprotein translocase subunit YajC